MRRIAGFLIASVSASLLFFAIFIPGGLLLSGRLAEWTMRIDGVAVLVWAVLGWPVVAIVGLFPALAFVRYSERTGRDGPGFHGLAGMAAALVPAIVWLSAQATSGGTMPLACVAAVGLLIAGALGGLVYWLIAGRKIESRTMAITD